MNCEGKLKHATERAALNELKRFRRGAHHATDIRSLKVYLCECGWWHLGRSFKTSRQEFPKVSPGEWKKLKRRVEDQGRQIAKDEDRYNRKRLQELDRIVAEDKLWLRRMRDAEQFHRECADALKAILDAYWRNR
jgi:hypothetical protein